MSNPLIESNKKKRKYYSKLKKKGAARYSMGGLLSVSNDPEVRGVRRYGFNRASVSQASLVKKQLLQKKLSKSKRNTKIRCVRGFGYTSKRRINALYKNSNFPEILKELYLKYQFIEVLLEDYGHGLRDRIFSRFMYLSKAREDESLLSALKEHYDEILVDSLISLVDKSDNYVEDSGYTYYEYCINVIPYYLTSNLLSIINYKDKHKELDENLLIYKPNYKDELNLLTVHILKNFQKIKAP